MENMVVIISAVVVIALIIFIGWLLVKLAGPRQAPQKLSEDLGAIKIVMENLQRIIPEIKGRVDSGAQAQENLQRIGQETARMIESLKTVYEDGTKLQDETRASIKRIESTMIGAPLKGKAGENILREALQKFPADMVATNFRVRGKVVEFGLVLPPHKKILPIDSKWPATGLLQELESEENEERRSQIAGQIEREVERRAKEVSQYLDPALTTNQAIAAVPDSAFRACRGAHVEAYKNRVIIISYSMLLPYLLTLLNLQLQYSRTIDIEYLGNCLTTIRRNLIDMNDILENSIVRGNVMIENAINDYRRLIGSIQSSITSLETAKPTEVKESEG